MTNFHDGEDGVSKEGKVSPCQSLVAGPVGIRRIAVCQAQLDMG